MNPSGRSPEAKPLSTETLAAHDGIVTQNGPSICLVLIVKSQRLMGEALRGVARSIFIGASVILATSVAEANQCFDRAVPDLLIADATFDDGDFIDEMPAWSERSHGALRVVVVTARKERRIVEAVARRSVHGFIDECSEGEVGVATALEAVRRGERYVSGSLQQRLSSYRERGRATTIGLTPTEQLVLSAVGDGADNETAAEMLSMRPSSVRSIREQLHHKLRIRHKGELTRAAAELGYVYIDADGVRRPGWRSLHAAKCRGLAHSVGVPYSE